jgi:hypothetical protein
MISEGTWRNWYHFYWNLREFQVFFWLQITQQGSQNLQEVLLLCKYTADATQI